MITTIHGFSSPKIMPVYKKYNKKTHYVSISDADRSGELDYIRTVYHGIDIEKFTLHKDYGESLINPETGGCYDGIMVDGLNRNQGAESIVGYCIASLALGNAKVVRSLK